MHTLFAPFSSAWSALGGNGLSIGVPKEREVLRIMREVRSPNLQGEGNIRWLCCSLTEDAKGEEIKAVQIKALEIRPEGLILDIPSGGPIQAAEALMKMLGLILHRVEVVTSWFGDAVARTRHILAGHHSLMDLSLIHI